MSWTPRGTGGQEAAPVNHYDRGRSSSASAALVLPEEPRPGGRRAKRRRRSWRIRQRSTQNRFAVPSGPFQAIAIQYIGISHSINRILSDRTWDVVYRDAFCIVIFIAGIPRLYHTYDTHFYDTCSVLRYALSYGSRHRQRAPPPAAGGPGVLPFPVSSRCSYTPESDVR